MLIDSEAVTRLRSTIRREGTMSTQVRVLTPRIVGLMVFVVVVYGFTPLILSGKWNWWGAWVYAVISAVGFAASRLLAGWRNPDLIDERARSIELQDAKPWDKILAPVVALGGILIAITAGLDYRYSWSVPFPLWAKIAATIIIILGYCLGT